MKKKEERSRSFAKRGRVGGWGDYGPDGAGQPKGSNRAGEPHRYRSTLSGCTRAVSGTVHLGVQLDIPPAVRYNSISLTPMYTRGPFMMSGKIIFKLIHVLLLLILDNRYRTKEKYQACISVSSPGLDPRALCMYIWLHI